MKPKSCLGCYWGHKCRCAQPCEDYTPLDEDEYEYEQEVAQAIAEEGWGDPEIWRTYIEEYAD